MNWLDLAIPLVASFEGCEKRRSGMVYPYLDTLAKPPRPTRGFGRTFDVTMDSPPITMDEAKAELSAGLSNYAKQILKLSPGLIDKPAMLAAVTSWAWNCGVGAYKASRLRRAINEERWADAAEFIRKPRTAGGVELRGLVRRRDAERALFLSGM